MPFWYALTLLLTVVEGAIYWHTSGRLPIWIVASSVLWMLVIVCICAPAGNERFFVELGVPVATRTTAPPKLDKIQIAEFAKKAKAVAAKYGTELLDRA